MGSFRLRIQQFLGLQDTAAETEALREELIAQAARIEDLKVQQAQATALLVADQRRAKAAPLAILIAAAFAVPMAVISLTINDECFSGSNKAQDGLVLALLAFASILWGANAFLEFFGAFDEVRDISEKFWLGFSIIALFLLAVIGSAWKWQTECLWKASFGLYVLLCIYSLIGLLVFLGARIWKRRKSNLVSTLLSTAVVFAFLLGTGLQFIALFSLHQKGVTCFPV